MPPTFREMLIAEGHALQARLDAVRAVVEHRSEKGRVLESAAAAMIRSWLPHEFGVGTGFVARPNKAVEGEVEMSPQLDIIIYDALRAAPLARFETCEVYPLEAVYGYVEVKATLQGKIKKVAETSADLRSWTTRHFLSYGQVRHDNKPANWDPMQTFVFAYEYAQGDNDADLTQAALQTHFAAVGPPASLASVLVGDNAFWSSTPTKPTPGVHEVRAKPGLGLALFKWRMLLRLAQFRRVPDGWVPHLGRYESWGS